MKKIISLILCIALFFVYAFAITSCKKADGDDAEQNDQDYTNALALIEAGDYTAAKALFEKLGDYKDSEEYLARFYYMPTSITYDLIDKKGTNEITYNLKNLPASELISREDTVGAFEFFYDDNGNIIEQRATNNGVVSSYVYTYDNDGKRIAATYRGADGSTASHTLEYDEHGNTVKQTYIGVDGSEYVSVMTYDENGNITSQESFYDGEIADTIYISNILDDKGRVIREDCIFSGGAYQSIEHTYDERGNHIAQVYTDNHGNNISNTYTYDANCNMVREVCTFSDGTVQYVEFDYILVYIPCGITAGTELFFTEFWESIL